MGELITRAIKLLQRRTLGDIYIGNAIPCTAEPGQIASYRDLLACYLIAILPVVHSRSPLNTINYDGTRSTYSQRYFGFIRDSV